jgi:aminoglycoside phosphotransferase (APT) family kinase protein
MTTAESTGVAADRADALLRCMRDAGSASDRARVTYLEQLEGGFSRHAHAARVADPERGDAEQAYIIRVRPQGATLDTDLAQEFRIFALLVDEPLPTPGVHGLVDREDTPFGGPFFVMDRLEGRAPNVWRGRDRAALQADWDGDRGIANDFVEHLAVIHRVDPARAAQAATPRTFTETVDHWQAIWEAQRLVSDPIVDEAYRWVRSREPDPVAPALVHSDYRIGNCLVADGHLTAILDWELAHVGDPRFDLGYMALDYHRGKFTTPGSAFVSAVADREWFAQRWSALTGRPVAPEVVDTFTALGALMLTSIMTTGLREYAEGRTHDIRMAWTRFVLPGIRQDLARLMEW